MDLVGGYVKALLSLVFLGLVGLHFRENPGAVNMTERLLNMGSSWQERKTMNLARFFYFLSRIPDGFMHQNPNSRYNVVNEYKNLPFHK